MDDYMRNYLKNLTNQEAWDALLPLTKLGKSLGELHVELDVPENIPYLEIKAGKIDLQRFFYWHVCKAFYKEEYTIDEMNHVNFDWYRPSNCHRHTPDEVLVWCDQAGLLIERCHAEEAGISVIAVKK